MLDSPLDKPPIRVAIVGLGFMGARHFQAFQASPHAQIVAVYSRDSRKLSGDLSGIQGNLGGPGGVYDFSSLKKYSDLAALLRDTEIDALDICLPTSLHASVGIAALEGGKDVLVEKPMALDAESAYRMVTAAESGLRILMAAHVLRFFPEYQALLQVVQSGELGAVRSGLFRRCCAAPAWSGWLADTRQSGGGAFDLLIHDLDICLRIFGQPETVCATGYEALASGVDVLTAQLAYSSGLSMEISGGWHHPKSFPFSMEYNVVLDGGTLHFRHETHPPTVYRKNGERQLLPLATQDGYKAEVDYFIDCCRRRMTPTLCLPTESAEAIRIFQLMLQSRAQNGSLIPC